MKVITIGRSEECSVVVNDAKVSRMHAQLVQDDEGRISVVDLGSTNGTRVNGARIAGEMRLNSGDEVRIGDTILPWQTYIATVPSQAVQPIGSSSASQTMLGEDSTTPGMPPTKKPQRKTLWIVLAVLLTLCIAGGAVWYLTKESKDDSIEGKDSGNTEKEEPTNTVTVGKEGISQAEKESLEDAVQREYEEALIEAAKKGEEEVKKLQEQLKKAQNEIKTMNESYNQYPQAEKERQERELERVDNEFKEIMKTAKEKAVLETYKKMVDKKIITKNDDLYDKLEGEEGDNIFKYHEGRLNAIKSCFKKEKKLSEKKVILDILNTEIENYPN
jgi:pSer/pThr/pTyr-binding forkhead associated (FHA) protein